MISSKIIDRYFILTQLKSYVAHRIILMSSIGNACCAMSCAGEYFELTVSLVATVVDLGIILSVAPVYNRLFQF